jgi:hypothetical protein
MKLYGPLTLYQVGRRARGRGGRWEEGGGRKEEGGGRREEGEGGGQEVGMRREEGNGYAIVDGKPSGREGEETEGREDEGEHFNFPGMCHGGRGGLCHCLQRRFSGQVTRQDQKEGHRDRRPGLGVRSALFF